MREARNLFTDPLPSGAGQWIMDNGNNSGPAATHSFANGQLLVHGADDTSNAYVLRHVMNVPAGDLVFSVTARSGSSPTFFANRLVKVMDTNWHGPLRGDIQHDRRQLQTMAFRSDVARRDGRIPCDPAIQPVLPVTSSLEVAA